ncbi:hypothetical protein ACROAE_07315 [Shewanella sp. MF05960]|uniref:hypothetical protein n=1 Tax=Shewanella sp. MF05960 TaxID=3434874 RepID=UPI003D7A4C12
MAKINVAIESSKVAQLIKAGHLCAADLQCLDRDSKQTLWQLCLWSCQKTQCQQNCPLSEKPRSTEQTIYDKDINLQTSIIS